MTSEGIHYPVMTAETIEKCCLSPYTEYTTAQRKIVFTNSLFGTRVTLEISNDGSAAFIASLEQGMSYDALQLSVTQLTDKASAPAVINVLFQQHILE